LLVLSCMPSGLDVAGIHAVLARVHSGSEHAS
jgi:hypothetical protein